MTTTAQPTPLEKAERRLLVIWMIGFVPILGLFFIQNHVGQKYGEDPTVAWQWFLGAIGPAVAPTTSFLFGAFFFAGPSSKKLTVSPTAYTVAKTAEVIYLLLIAGLLISEPIFNSGPAEEWLNRSSTPVIATQTIVQGILDVCIASMLVTSS